MRCVVRTPMALLLGGVLAGAAPAGETVRAKAPGGALAGIEPNTWVAAKPRYVLPEHIKDARWQTTDGYCGATYRSRTSTILWRTGVRSKSAGLSPGFYSNTTLEWDLTANVARAVEVANWGGGSYGGGRLLPAYKDHPTPTPRHTYDGIAYVPEQDAMYFILGANWRVASKAAADAKAEHARDHQCTWKYEFAKGRWQRIEDSVRRFYSAREVSPYEAHMQHWPEGKRLLFLDSRGRHYAEFDLNTHKWSPAKLANKCPMSLYNARSTWDSKRQLWVFRLGPKLCTFDPRTRSYRALPDCPADEKDRSKAVAFISRHDAYLVTGPTGNDTAAYDVEKGTWRRIAGGDIKLVNGYAQYDPKTDLVALVYQLEAFVFRYQPGSLPATRPAKPQE